MDLSWMAWTWPTAAFFGTIFLLLVAMTVWEIRRPGGAPRVRILGPNNSPALDFFAFDPSFTGGIYVG